MSAILFGSISTVADTSELQREAFNHAFADHGLDWNWDRAEYVAMLDRSGGASRIAEYASSRGDDVDAAAVHAAKSQHFQESLATSGVSPRPGVVEAVKGARAEGLKVGLVTTTSRENITALLEALSPELDEDDFDVIVDSSDVDDPKPDPAAYLFALDALGEQALHCVAIEDNVEGAVAATAAGLRSVAFPNVNTEGQEFATADLRVEQIDLAELRKLAADA